jgi:hypothetical protein
MSATLMPSRLAASRSISMIRLQALVLEVAGDIGEFRQVLEVRHQIEAPTR